MLIRSPGSTSKIVVVVVVAGQVLVVVVIIVVGILSFRDAPPLCRNENIRLVAARCSLG